MDGSRDEVELVLLGSGAVRVNRNRRGPAQVVRVGQRAMLLDCGRCAAHGLVACGFAVEAIPTVFVTHLHFDHICDLPHIVLLGWNNGRDRPLHIYGPDGLADFMEHGLRRAYEHDIRSRLAHGKDPTGLEFRVVEIRRDGPFLSEADWVVSALATPHAGLANLNYRLDAAGRSIVITSDTEPAETLVAFCRDVDLLVCECSGTAAFLGARPWGAWHMSPDDVGRLAAAARAKTVVLKHLVIEDWVSDPGIAETMAQEVRSRCDAEVIVGQDGLRLVL